MKDNFDYDRHFGGKFTIVDETIPGEIIYNKKSGVIILHLTKQVDSLGQAYGNIKHIHGTLYTGAKVTLINNKCRKNHTHNIIYQELIFMSEYMILGTEIAESKQFDKLTFILDNALAWSGLTQVDTSEYNKIRVLNNVEDLQFNWFNSKITFSTQIKNEFNSIPRNESCCISEKLIIRIESNTKQDLSFFINVRDSIISLISFAIKDNVNIEEQHLIDFNDYSKLPDYPEYKEYNKYGLVCKRPYYQTYNTNHFDYNFSLKDLTNKDDIADAIIKLNPIFHLYESLFKYKDMPSEMIFLNIVQALETFHSRFFYNDDKEEYVKSVEERYSTYAMYV